MWLPHPIVLNPIVLFPLFLQACDFLALVRFHMPMDFPLFFMHVIICLSKTITRQLIFPLFSLICDIFSYSALTNPSSKRKRMINQLTNPPQKDDESPQESSGRFPNADWPCFSLRITPKRWRITSWIIWKIPPCWLILPQSLVNMEMPSLS